MLRIDWQKLMILLSLLIKNFYEKTLLKIYFLIWKKKIKHENDQEKYELSFKNIIKKYEFNWLNSIIFDWKSNNFNQEIAKRFPFSVWSLEKHYQARKMKRKMMTKFLQEINQVIERIQLLDDNIEDEWSKRFLIWWMTMRIIKQYYNDIWIDFYEFPYNFVRKDNK